MQFLLANLKGSELTERADGIQLLSYWLGRAALRLLQESIQQTLGALSNAAIMVIANLPVNE